jgi:DNA-binding MarR family transcriptional regulator
MGQDDAARSAWRNMRTLVMERHDRRAEVAARLGIGFIRIKALGKLDHAPMTMRELAALLAVDAPYTTVIVDDLESRGLAERRPDPHDRRRKIVAVTAAGRRLARRAARLLDEPPTTLSALPAEDIAHLDRIIGVLLDGGLDAPAPSPPRTT